MVFAMTVIYEPTGQELSPDGYKALAEIFKKYRSEKSGNRYFLPPQALDEISALGVDFLRTPIPYSGIYEYGTYSATPNVAIQKQSLTLMQLIADEGYKGGYSGFNSTWRSLEWVKSFNETVQALRERLDYSSNPVDEHTCYHLLKFVANAVAGNSNKELMHHASGVGEIARALADSGALSVSWPRLFMTDILPKGDVRELASKKLLEVLQTRYAAEDFDDLERVDILMQAAVQSPRALSLFVDGFCAGFDASKLPPSKASDLLLALVTGALSRSSEIGLESGNGMLRRLGFFSPQLKLEPREFSDAQWPVYLLGSSGLRAGVESQALTERIELLAKMGFDVNAPMYPHGVTLLMQACNDAAYPVCSALIAAGADVSVADEKGWTALHFVCHSKTTGGSASYPLQIVSELLMHGADPNARTKIGEMAWGFYTTPSDYLCGRIGKGFRHAGSELMIVLNAKWLEEGVRLIKAGEPLDLVDPSGRSMADVIARTGMYQSLYEALKEAGFDFNSRCRYKPWSRDEDDFKPQDRSTFTTVLVPLSHRLILCRDEDLPLNTQGLRRMLEDKVFDLEDCDEDGKTALYVAVARGRTEMVKMLLEAGADPEVRAGKRTLIQAAKSDELKTLIKSARVDWKVSRSMAASQSDAAPAPSRRKGLSL